MHHLEDVTFTKGYVHVAHSGFIRSESIVTHQAESFVSYKSYPVYMQISNPTVHVYLPAPPDDDARQMFDRAFRKHLPGSYTPATWPHPGTVFSVNEDTNLAYQYTIALLGDDHL